MLFFDELEGSSVSFLFVVRVGGSPSFRCPRVRCLRVWRRFAPMLYTPEGKRQIEELWEETMTELQFVTPLAILAEVGGKAQSTCQS